MNIYVASSWRNERQPEVVSALRRLGADVYDFKNPAPGDHGFHWSEIDHGWERWTPEAFRAALDHSIADRGFSYDMQALMDCDVCVLLMPSGRSAHIEAGYASGAGKKLVILLAPGEPELMYKMADFVCCELEEVISAVSVLMKWERMRNRAGQAKACPTTEGLAGGNACPTL